MDRPDLRLKREPGADPAALPLDDRVASALAPGVEILRVLGQGASARVYLAREVALDRLVTIKVLRPEVAASPEASARFEREARAAANINHPNVSAVYRFGILTEGEPYLVMQYVRGRSLADRVAAEGPLGVAEARGVIADVAAALEAAHAQGVVHRDIRPANILLDEDNSRALVTDFGLAALTESWSHGDVTKLTKTGQLLGDPHYVSPEQFRGETVTEATDLYSTALVAYEAVTGQMPHADAGAREAAVARLTAEPIEMPAFLEEEDPQLSDLLTRCLAAEPSRRPSARAIAQRLQAREPERDEDWDARRLLPTGIRRVWRNLYRRRVPQWVTGATAGGWLLLEAVSQAIENEVLPPVLYRIVLASVLAAIPFAAVLAWFHGERGDQRVHPLEIWLLLLIAAAWIATLLAIFT